ncbi:hypothetical protein PTTG_05779 [Puccinia triticina 1-1 BBBD Race 1]|uniref:Polyketide_cyc domain-containing protein n=2 Tax=Puccinia triticina TaxID=208348 RepID=A0A180GX53_PUCT1|nr:uncharacterized protein PtA15_6A792 [Puccinia triticina]OAV97101.1 hypothetical protein PTTG_05779 [Puccinia triticina 1-1 BBBD Race 1]WAQ86160.1 hypothetical protein PtA15_6A792 [Puccinia triticina]
MFYVRSIRNIGRSWSISSSRNFSQSSIRAGSHQLVKIVPYDRSQIYSVIVDVKSYPEFIPYCLSTRIIEPSTAQDQNQVNLAASHEESGNAFEEHEFEVFTRIGYKGFETDYHSRVICQPFDSVQVIAKPSTTFTKLTTTWKLSDHPSSSGSSSSDRLTRVQLDLSFKFKNPIHEYLLTDERIWNKFSGMVIKSFEDRLASL